MSSGNLAQGSVYDPLLLSFTDLNLLCCLQLEERGWQPDLFVSLHSTLAQMQKTWVQMFQPLIALRQEPCGRQCEALHTTLCFPVDGEVTSLSSALSFTSASCQVEHGNQ